MPALDRPIEHRATLSPRLVGALEDTKHIAFVLGSCRHPGNFLERERSDAVFGAICDELTARESPEARQVATPVSRLLLVGDQIYYDATANLFDTMPDAERFVERYRTAFGSKHMRKLLARLPTVMVPDDHEIGDGWERDQDQTARRKRFARWGLDACLVYQASHLHDLARFWGEFESSGFGFFVMDTRTERSRGDDGKPPALISDDQRKALEKFLLERQKKDGARPKFVVCASPIAPLPVVGSRYPARDDGWCAFAATRDALLQTIREKGIANVVFLSGDAHCAVSARVTVKRAGGNGPLHAACITGSPFYAPFPFANAHPEDFLATGELAHNVSYEVVAGSACALQSCFSLIEVAQHGNGWRVAVQVKDAGGQPRASVAIDLPG